MADDAQPLIQARLKVYRARFHIQELAGLLLNYMQNPSNTRIETYEREAGQWALDVVSEPFPPAVPLMIGDAVHNLRTALDYTTTELCVGGLGDNRIGFPFHQTEQNVRTLVAIMVDKHGLPTDIADIILSEMKPWEKGNYELWALNRLDRLDRHKLIIPVSVVTRIHGVEANSRKMRFTNLELNILSNGRVEFFLTSDPITITKIAGAEINVVFTTEQGFGGKPVVNVLQELADMLLGFFDLLESHIKRKGSASQAESSGND